MTLDEISYVAAGRLREAVPQAPWSLIGHLAVRFARGEIGPGEAVDLAQAHVDKGMSDLASRLRAIRKESTR